MGRDVAGIRIANKPIAVDSKPNGATNGAVNVSNKILAQRVETKAFEAEDHGTRGTVGECKWKQDVLSVKSLNCNTGMPEEKPTKAETKSSNKMLSSPMEPILESTAATGTLDTNPIISKPSSLGTKHHANGTDTVDSGSNYSTNSNDLDSPMTANKPQQSSPLAPRKLQQLDDRKYHDEEDNWSLASSTAASVRSTKSKITIPVAPTFRSEERAARRKEFHMKLEEKHKALEAQKQEQAARAKEEEDAAITKLRRSMVYKANPVPSFYREGPPPKAELKKLPVTRAKSPNLTRRKSCSDVIISFPEEKKICARAHHSIGSYTEGSISPSTPKTNDQGGGRSANGTIRVNGGAKSIKETMETPVHEAKEFPVKEIKETPVEEIKKIPVEEMKETPVKEIKQTSAE